MTFRPARLAFLLLLGALPAACGQKPKPEAALPVVTVAAPLQKDVVDWDDFVGRFESLALDLKLALDHVGLSLDAELPRAKTTFRGNSISYRDYYDDDTRAIVAHWYEREIELLNYEF